MVDSLVDATQQSAFQLMKSNREMAIKYLQNNSEFYNEIYEKEVEIQELAEAGNESDYIAFSKDLYDEKNPVF